MLKIASEVGASETAYYNVKTGSLRWFTPKIEIDLCGHATLATVCVLKNQEIIREGQEIIFKTRSGELKAAYVDKKIKMDFPLAEKIDKVEPNSGIIEKLGLNKNNIKFYGKSGTKTLIVVEDENEIKKLTPDFSGLIKEDGFGVLVTAKSSASDRDFTSRYFHPWAGVNEDPVTGSAHCVLAKYWGEKLSKSRMTGYQASARGGFVEVEILNEHRVLLIGNGIIVINGTIEIDS